jgi:hypothetical protein
MENLGKPEHLSGYPPVIEILMWHCHGLSCEECRQYPQECAYKDIIGEHTKLGHRCILPSQN